MKKRGLIALALVIIMVSSSVDKFAFAQDDADAVTSAPQTVEQPTAAAEEPTAEVQAPITETKNESAEEKTEAPKETVSNTVVPSAAIQASDVPATDAPATDAPATDTPATDAPATDTPATDAPATDAPTTDAPVTDAPATDIPATDAPATDAPATDVPATDAPATDAPVTDAPATDIPATDAPATDAPATDVPATDAPATDAPATESPTPESTPTQAIAITSYIFASKGTLLYSDKTRTVKLGVLTKDAVLFATEIQQYETENLYELQFDTSKTKNDSRPEVGYFRASDVDWLNENDSKLGQMSSVRKLNNSVEIPYIDFEYEEAETTAPEPTADPTEEPTAEPTPQPVIYGTSTAEVNMRQEPTTSSDRVAVVAKGTEVEVLGAVIISEDELWYLISLNGKQGYIRSDLLTVEEIVPIIGEESDDAVDPTEDPAESEEPIPTENPDDAKILHTIQTLREDGTPLLSYEVEEGVALDEGTFQSLSLTFVGQILKGWFLCDENGNLLSDQPVVFETPITESLYIIAVMETESELPAEDGEPQEAPEHDVIVSIQKDTEVLNFGTVITLSAELIGYEDAQYLCSWQAATIDEQGNVISEWQDTGIDTIEHSYILTEENLLTAWRMCVTTTAE